MMDRAAGASTTNNAATATRRKPIPRPWLENRRLSHEAHQKPTQLQHQQHQQQQFTNAEISWQSKQYEYVDEDQQLHHQFQRPIFLLEKPDIRKSFFNLECCFPSKERLNNSNSDNDNHDNRVPPVTLDTAAQAQGLESYFHEGSTTVVYPPPPPHVTTIPQQRPSLVRDSSVRWFTPTPTVIYVIHSNSAAMPPSQDDIHQWHQSFMSSQQQQQMPPLPMNRDRVSSYDTGMTSLSCEDSLAFLDDLRREPYDRTATAAPPPAPALTRQGSGRRLHQRTATATNLSIPRPPPMTRKAQSTASGLPPKPPILAAVAAPLSRPAPLRARAATTGSTSSWSTGSRHRRSPGLTDVLDSATLQSIIQSEQDGLDDDFDDASTIASSEGDSPIFPFLPAVSTASLHGGNGGKYGSSVATLQQEQVYLEEVYLPKCSVLERTLQDCGDTSIASVPLLSGWVAYSLGDSLSHKRQLTRQHLAYLMMDDLAGAIYFRQPPALPTKQDEHTSSSSGQESGEDGPFANVSSPPESSSSMIVFKLPRNNKNNKISVQTLESQGGAGRSVVIRNHENKTLLTLLPVNLSPRQFCCETGQLLTRSLLNSSTSSSVAQHDAALYLWFGLDGWVRRQEQKQHEQEH